MNLTEKQSEIIEKAIEILQPFDKIIVSDYLYYFEEQDEDGDSIGNHDFSDYDSCDSDECIALSLSQLKEKYPDINIETVYYSNDGDHEKFERCTHCGRPLNRYLTWIESELEYHFDESKTKQDFIDSNTAFEIVSCLTSIRWSVDYRITPYQERTEPEKAARAERGFVHRVTNYAQYIINTFSQ